MDRYREVIPVEMRGVMKRYGVKSDIPQDSGSPKQLRFLAMIALLRRLSYYLTDKAIDNVEKTSGKRHAHADGHDACRNNSSCSETMG